MRLPAFSVRSFAERNGRKKAKRQKSFWKMGVIEEKSVTLQPKQFTQDVKIKEVVAALERFAPLPLQDEYDNAGLQIGLTEVEVSGALLCLDVTEAIVREAVSQGCNLIVAHHPLLFRALKHITGQTQPERCAALAVKHDVAIYAAHTNLDNARGGVNFEIANRLGLQGVRFLKPAPDGQSGSGIVGELAEPENAEAFLRRVKDIFHVESLQHNSLLERPVRTVAVCGGAGDFLLGEALRQKADAFLTGEMHYHVFFGHEQEIQIGVMGHYQSEQFTIDLLGDVLKNALPELRLVKTKIKTNPISYM